MGLIHFKKSVSSVAWVLPSVPVSVFAIFLIYTVLFYLELGRLPVVYEDSLPENLKLIDAVAGYSLIALFCTLPVATFTWLSLIYKPVRDLVEKQIRVYFGSLALVFLFLVVPPVGYVFFWLLD